MNKLFLIILSILSIQSFAQKKGESKIYRITSAHTSFPDSARANGHLYEGVLYTAAEHYKDSSVLIIVPPQFNSKDTVDVICWFHGWRNTIDSSVGYFELAKQFLASNRNAIFIVPETTKDAPDSYGGKLEQHTVFKYLLNDVLAKLKKERIIDKGVVEGNVVLAGHSGAFRVMAFIAEKGGVAINQIVLFDGLYSQIDKFSNWLQADSARRFINLYTNKGGGTDNVSIKMMEQLRDKKIAFVRIEEKEINSFLLQTNPVIFIHSEKEHNDVMNRPDQNFRLFLENSPLLRPVFLLKKSELR